MMKKKSSILGRSESVRAPVSYYGERDTLQQIQRGRLLHLGPTSEQADYMSEDGMIRHTPMGQGPTGNGPGANKRVSFNRDVAVKRIPSVLHHNRPNTAGNSTPTTPAAVVVVFPSNNNATVSQINGRGGRRGANLGSLEPDQQQMLLREARNVLEQMESISCQVSRDSQIVPQQQQQQQWRYSSSPSPPPSPVLMPRRRAAHPPPVSRPLKRSESLAGIFYSTRHQEPVFLRDQSSPHRLLNSHSNSNLNLSTHGLPPAPRVVKKRSPSVRTPLFPQKSNNSLGESSGSGSSGEAGESPGISATSKIRSGSGGILPPTLWPDSFSYNSASGSTSTPSPISSLSSASSAGSATKKYFFGQDAALHSDLNENVMFKQPQSLKIFQNHHNKGLGIGTSTSKPTGFMSEDESTKSGNRQLITNTIPKNSIPYAAAAAPTTLNGLGTLDKKKQTGNNITPIKKFVVATKVPDPPPPPPLPPKSKTTVQAAPIPPMKKPNNVTTVFVNPSNSSGSGEGSSSSSSECGVSLAGEDADDDEEEEMQKYPLILRATSALDTHPAPAPSAPKPFFYGDRLPTNTNGATLRMEPKQRFYEESHAPPTITNDQNRKHKSEKDSTHSAGGGGGFMSTLLRRKSAKISIKSERSEITSPPIVLQLGTEQRLQQKQQRQEENKIPPPINTKRPTRVKSFLALFMGRGGSGPPDVKNKHFAKGGSISTPSLEAWNKTEDDDIKYLANYKSNNHYY